ncbi:OprO/OprP family phosphate-selective porin [Phenylobacterium sp. 58.2.17]|uniref:OprO/OprP family phosphate-selective porin n=1 Tax=Phenylobacterium sp. 58.2.17 TaxID=2969306 RepID=UPI0022647360|nr:porin [Phenylobacterium sp. 58.2.17]MCX7586268.1 porin [Phenylobacterium sp. 58.2.17]
MTWKTKLITGAAAIAFAWPGLAAADEATDARIKALEEQLTALQSQLADLKQSTANNIADVRKEATATTVSLANGRPTISTADGAFTASFRGVFQLDAAHYDQDAAGPLATDFRRGSFGDANENDHARDLSDGANFRRARIGIEGKAFGAFDYNFLYDFGGSGTEEAGKISAAWVQYGFPVANLKLRIGAFSPPSGLEEAVSTNGSLFVERASPAETVRAIAAGDGRTAVALLAGGDNWTGTAAITGNIIGTSSFDEQTAFVGRLTYVPFRRDDSLIHVGVNTSIVFNPAAGGPDVTGAPATTNIRLRDRPEIRVDGTRLIDTGNIDADGLTAIGAEFGAQWKNLYVQTEYFDIDVDRKGALSDPDFSGWYAQAGWTLTGEPRRYSAGTFDAPRPAKPFDLKKGTWGAWELGLRYSVLDLNYLAGSPGTAPVASAIRGGEQEIFTLGLNWYVNNVLRFQAAFQDVSVDRLSPGGTAFGTGAATPPAGAQVGQDFNIYSLRTQYAF